MAKAKQKKKKRNHSNIKDRIAALEGWKIEHGLPKPKPVIPISAYFN